MLWPSVAEVYQAVTEALPAVVVAQVSSCLFHTLNSWRVEQELTLKQWRHTAMPDEAVAGGAPERLTVGGLDGWWEDKSIWRGGLVSRCQLVSP